MAKPKDFAAAMPALEATEEKTAEEKMQEVVEDDQEQKTKEKQAEDLKTELENYKRVRAN